MKPLLRLSRIAVIVLSLAAMASAQKGFPFQDESLRYSVNWPSGLSLGEASLSAHHAGGGWEFELSLEASVPTFAVADHVHATANGALCSTILDRETRHGARKAHDKTLFDYKKGTAKRTTVLVPDGGSSEFPISACARDALTFVYYTRREMGQGHVPPREQVYFGPGYSVRMEYTGARMLAVNDKPAEQTDRLLVYVKGPTSDTTLEIFFARDAARTPLAIKVPFSVGTLSMELVR